MHATTFTPVVLALCLAGCAMPGPSERVPVHTQVQAERSAYVECTVRAAFRAPLARATLARQHAQAAMATCASQRLALLDGLRQAADAAGEAALAAGEQLRLIDEALVERLAAHLYRRALLQLSDGKGTPI